MPVFEEKKKERFVPINFQFFIKSSGTRTEKRLGGQDETRKIEK